MRKTVGRKKEFSKKILFAVAIATTIIVAFSLAIVWKTGDTSPLGYIIPGVFAELATATGFYYWKAKAENQIKLKQLYGEVNTENSQITNTSTYENM
ncbi:MAG: hypothetical protein RR162_00370 [Oscillospiraceae bacterium]